MAHSETFQMSIDRPPEGGPLSECRHEAVPTELSPSPNENYGSSPRSRLETDQEPAAMGPPQPSSTRSTVSAIRPRSCFPPHEALADAIDFHGHRQVASS